MALAVGAADLKRGQGGRAPFLHHEARGDIRQIHGHFQRLTNGQRHGQKRHNGVPSPRDIVNGQSAGGAMEHRSRPHACHALFAAGGHHTFDIKGFHNRFAGRHNLIISGNGHARGLRQFLTVGGNQGCAPVFAVIFALGVHQNRQIMRLGLRNQKLTQGGGQQSFAIVRQNDHGDIGYDFLQGRHQGRFGGVGDGGGLFLIHAQNLFRLQNIAGFQGCWPAFLMQKDGVNGGVRGQRVPQGVCGRILSAKTDEGAMAPHGGDVGGNVGCPAQRKDRLLMFKNGNGGLWRQAMGRPINILIQNHIPHAQNAGLG